MSKTPQKVVVMLDALIDTRIGTAIKLKADDIDWEGYRDRKHSYVWEFFKVSKEVFQRAYARRDTDTLKNSVATVLTMNIEANMANKIIAGKSNPLLDDPEIVINLWPFKLSRAITREITQSVRDTFTEGSSVTVSTVHMHPRELNPSWLKANNADLIVYDLVEWFNYNNTKLEECPIPELSLVFPATLNAEDVNKYSYVEGHDPFEDLAAHIAPVIKLVAVDPILMSLDLGLLLQHDRPE